MPEPPVTIHQHQTLLHPRTPTIDQPRRFITIRERLARLIHGSGVKPCANIYESSPLPCGKGAFHLWAIPEISLASASKSIS